MKYTMLKKPLKPYHYRISYTNKHRMYFSVKSAVQGELKRTIRSMVHNGYIIIFIERKETDYIS